MKIIPVILIICSFAACDRFGREEFKKELKKEIIAELDSSNTKPQFKGDGSNFYPELKGTGANEIYIQHSTLKCPAIRNGVQKNCYKLNAYNNTFCTVCMDDSLIEAWNNRFFPNGYKR